MDQDKSILAKWPLSLVYSKLNIKKKITRFEFKVSIKKLTYIKMIKQRYISSLLKFKPIQILKGIKEINLKYKKKSPLMTNLIV